MAIISRLFCPGFEAMLEELNAKEQSQFQQVAETFAAQRGPGIADSNMIEEGDKIMGLPVWRQGQLCHARHPDEPEGQRPIHFDLVAVNLDQKQPGFPEHVLPEYLSTLGIDFKIVEEDTYSIVRRRYRRADHLRSAPACARGILYRTARELGCTKIALGHHRDDILETLFLNMFYGGKFQIHAPKLVSDVMARTW